MDKNKQQLIVLGIVAAIFVTMVLTAILKPRARTQAAKSKSVPVTAPVGPKLAPQKERVKSSYKSWGRDPFAVGVTPAEQAGSGPASLSGIFCDPKKSYCIIDGKIAKVGDEVSGVKVLTITSDSVTIKTSEGIKVLRLGR